MEGHQGSFGEPTPDERRSMFVNRLTEQLVAEMTDQLHPVLRSFTELGFDFQDRFTPERIRMALQHFVAEPEYCFQLIADLRRLACLEQLHGNMQTIIWQQLFAVTKPINLQSEDDQEDEYSLNGVLHLTWLDAIIGMHLLAVVGDPEAEQRVYCAVQHLYSLHFSQPVPAEVLTGVTDCCRKRQAELAHYMNRQVGITTHDDFAVELIGLASLKACSMARVVRVLRL